MRRCPIIVAALLALAPASAQADDDFVPASQVPEVARWLPVAEAAWPGSHCVGREQVRITDLPDGVAGRAVIGDEACRFEIAPTLGQQPSLTCKTIVHELGHLAGLDHSSDPYDVMFGGPSSTSRNTWWPPCAIAAGQQDVAARITLALLPGVGPETCRPLLANIEDCTASVRVGMRSKHARFIVAPIGGRWVARRVKIIAMRRNER